MEKNQEKFLEKYKKLENILTKLDAGMSVREYEETILDQSVRSKLYVCRVLRNYMQHNADYKKFVAISDEMLEFLDSMYEEIYGKLMKVSDVMTTISRTNYRTMDDKVMDAIKILNKGLLMIPVLDKNKKLIGIFSNESLQKVCLKNKVNCKLEDVKDCIKVNKSFIVFVKKDELLEEVLEEINDNKLILCTDNGKSTGKIIGLIMKKDLEKIKE